MIEPRLDHLVYATPDLDGLVADVTARTGVAPVPGGRHPTRGTRNYLAALGGAAYLELIGPDEPGGRPGTFGIDQLTGPRLVAWLVRPADIEATVRRARAAGYDPGDIVPLSRHTPDGELLAWRLTAHLGGLVPGLIDWLDATHPTATGLPELRLASLRATHPRPDDLRADLRALDVHLDVDQGQAALVAEIDTPNGRVTVS